MTGKPAATAWPGWTVSAALFVLGQLVAAGATYAAIRADLREALVEAHAAATSAAKAHDRIDRMQERGR